MLILKAELQSIIHKETAFALFRLCRKYFESGDKYHPYVIIQDQSFMNKHKSIKLSGNFIQISYQSEGPKDEQEMETFFKDLHLPTLKEEDREQWETPVCTSEIISALKALPTGKAPGNDGYTIEFYKYFQHNHNTILFNDIITNQAMPLSMRQATISLLPKPGKDHSQMSNCRTFSLLNNDYKLFAKILAVRTETVISSLIHLDQVGFI